MGLASRRRARKRRSGDGEHLISYDPTDGKTLWHSGLAAPVSNTPITYMLDDVQYVLVAGGDSLYAFSLQK